MNEKKSLKNNSKNDFKLLNSNNRGILRNGNNEIYVSLNGSDLTGDGSITNPYQSLEYGIKNAGDNSTIFLFDGEYTDESTNLTVENKNLRIKALNSNVTINGNNTGYILHMINSSVILESLNIINGYGDTNTEYAISNNNGSLTLVSCRLFNNIGFVSSIFNNGSFIITDSNLTSNQGTNLMDIFNYGNMSIESSYLYSNSIFSYGNISMHNSDMYSSLFSDNRENLSEINVLINNTVFHRELYPYLSLNDSNVLILNSKIYGHEGYFRNSFYNCTADIESSVIDSEIEIKRDNNITIKYSTLFKVIGSNMYPNKFINLSSNWWESNKGPNIYYLNDSIVDNWIIVNFTSNTPLTRYNDSNLKVILKYSDGNSTYDIDDNHHITDIDVRFECENGKFSESSGTIRNHIFETLYYNNTEETLVYAIVNKQRMKLPIGRGYTDYTIYVSVNGSDRNGTGSREKPFESLSKALSVALNGNTIYITGGVYKGYYNTRLRISKNLSFISIDGPVTIKTYLNNDMFLVDEWGTLNLRGITFESDKNQNNNIIGSSGGDINIENCTFTNILSKAVIYVNSGYDSYGNIFMNNTLFSNIRGVGIYGSPSLRLLNCNFTGFTQYTTDQTYEYRSVIATSNNLYIDNCNFVNNSESAIFSGFNSATQAENVDEIKIINTRFINNLGTLHSAGYTKLSVVKLDGDYENDTYIINSSFIENTGFILIGADNVINSSFIGNKGNLVISNGDEYYYSGSLRIYNSSFISNENTANQDADYYNHGIIFNGGTLIVENSTFINNSAAYGAAIYNNNNCTVRYSVFLNNTAKYLGNDVFNRYGTMNISYNWWGSNEGPTSSKAHRFLGNLIIDDWIIMDINMKNYTDDSYDVEVGLNKLTNQNREIYDVEHLLIQDIYVYFSCSNGIINQTSAKLVNGTATVNVKSSLSRYDAVVSARIHDQIVNLTITNSSTEILIDNFMFYGEEQKINMSLINVNGYKIANKTLYVSIIDSDNVNQGTYRVKTDDNGYADLILNLEPDMYNAVVRYDGDDYYKNTSSTSILNVLILSTNIIAYNQTYYGRNNNFYVIIKDGFNNPLVNRTIYFNISDGKHYFVYITNCDNTGRADIHISQDPGKYTIFSYFKGNKWYEPSNYTVSISIYPSKSRLLVNNTVLYGYGDIFRFRIMDDDDNPIKYETVKFIITKGNVSQLFNLTSDDEGYCELAINLLPDNYNVSVVYDGNKNYGPSNENRTLKIMKIISRIVCDFNINLTQTDNTIQIRLIDLYGREIPNQNISLTVQQNDIRYQFNSTTDVNGYAYIKADILPGEYQAIINYTGNEWYNKTSSGISLSKDYTSTIDTNITIKAEDLIQYYGADKYFNISFHDPNSARPEDKEITINLIGNNTYSTYTLYTDNDGIARLKIQLDPGKYIITYKYDNIYYGIHVNGTNNITVLKTPTYIIAENISTRLNDGQLYEFTLKDINGKTLENQKLEITLKSNYGTMKYNLTTDNYGIARLKTDFKGGKYNVTSRFIGNDNYYNTTNSSVIKILGPTGKNSTYLEYKDMTQESVDLKNGERGGYFNVYLKNQDDVELVNKTVYIGFNGVTYKRTTDENGMVQLQINLKYPGTYTFAIAFLNDGYSEGSFAVAKITITKKVTKLTVPQRTYNADSKNKYITATLKDRNNNLLKGKKLTFTVNNKKYTATTNQKGTATIKVNLNTKKIYTVIVTYAGDNTCNKATDTSKLTIK